jgi:hypothetical protein
VFERFTPPGPSRPLRYELHRASGVRTGWFVAAAALAASLIASVALALTSSAPATRLLAGWPAQLPLPPAAIAAGLLGALAFGQEYRYPALAHAQGTVPHRLGLLAAKLAVSGAAAVALGAMSVFIDGGVLLLLFGSDTIALQFDWTTEAASWAGLGLGCAWAGLLAAGLFRSTSMGLAAVLAVPVLVLPALQMVLSSPATRSFAVLPGGLRSPPLPDRPSAVDRWITLVLRLLSQPIGQALTLSLVALLCGYLFVTLRRRAR